MVRNHSRLAEFDQVLVCGSRMEAADVQVRFTQLFPSPAAAVTTTVSVRTGRRHLMAGGHIGLLQLKKERISISALSMNTKKKSLLEYFIFSTLHECSEVSYYSKSQKLKGDVDRQKVILQGTDDYVGAAKNDIIQASCQHSPILLSEGNVGPLGCLLHIGKKGLLCFLHVG